MAATAVDMPAMVVATDMAVATDTTARGLLMPSPRLRPRLSLAMATTDVATAMVVTVAVMAVATTARGLLMPSLRLMPLLRLSPATAATAMATTARGRLRLSLATAMAVMAVDTAAMVATGATAIGVSYHRIRRSELSQKQNHKNSQR